MQPIHHATMPSVTALDNSSGTNGASDSSSGNSDTTITANDFLTLLVTEMKNQDPTADTDPNAYIDQLVQVNSLQQLIQINQDLAPLSGSSSSGSGDGSGSGSNGDGNSNQSSQALGAASRLATALTEKHPQPEAASGSTADPTSDAVSRAAAAFKTAVHQS